MDRLIHRLTSNRLLYLEQVTRLAASTGKVVGRAERPLVLICPEEGSMRREVPSVDTVDFYGAPTTT